MGAAFDTHSRRMRSGSFDNGLSAHRERRRAGRSRPVCDRWDAVDGHHGCATRHDGKRSGQSFTATVQTPLRSATGTVLVPAGSKVHGTLASSGSADNPRLRLDLQTIETTQGSAPIQAAVRHASRTEYAGPTQFVPVDDDPYLYSYDSAAWGWWGPMGGGPVYGAYTPTEIRIPRGASVQLVLTRPIIPPGTTVQ